MAEPRRVLRLQQLVLETLATALVKDVDDPRLKGVTITRVKLSKDLSRALVFWSNLEPGGPRRTAERGIEDALAYLQAIVADAMTTRVTPHLEFKFDEGLERAGRIQQIFDKLSHERGDAPEDAPASSPTAEDDGGEEADEADDDTLSDPDGDGEDSDDGEDDGANEADPAEGGPRDDR